MPVTMSAMAAAEVHVEVFVAVIESVRDDMLAVEEAYRARWDGADQGGYETFK